MTRDRAIQFLREMKNLTYVATDSRCSAIDMAIESLSAEPSEQYKKGFEDAKRALLLEYARESENMRKRNAELEVMLNSYREASAEPKWITDRKPTDDGTYMVTLDAFGLHRFVKSMHYGKPLMPNRKVKEKCWYDSDDEYGDVVYYDEEILAWMPLPKPYSERREP